MFGIILLYIFLLGTLLFLGNVTATVTVINDIFHAEIDCSGIKLILYENEETRRKRKLKKKRSLKHKLSALLSLPPSLNFLLSRSKITVNSMSVPTRASYPHQFFTRSSLLNSALTLILSFLFSKAKEVTVTDGVLNFPQQPAFSSAVLIDFSVVCTLYNVILFGLFFLFESIKRRIKNARKQNE